MIKTKTVVVTCSGRTYKFYKEKGYSIPMNVDNRGRVGVKKGTKIEVSVYDLPPASNQKITYECDDCGSLNIVCAYTLFHRENSQYKKTGETICGNCANKRMSGENNSNYIHGDNRYCEYIVNARKRGILFELTVEQFKHLTSKDCHYCGGFSSEWDSRSRGNGIDRKSSEDSYNLLNCVTCCSKCNFVKNSMPYDTFINYIKRIAGRF